MNLDWHRLHPGDAFWAGVGTGLLAGIGLTLLMDVVFAWWHR